MERHITATEDGSQTIFSKDFQQHYHSHFGALQESRHIFINNGFYAPSLENKKALNILEIGFGTGLNALLSIDEAHTSKRKIYYEAIELYPLSLSETSALHYAQLLENPDAEHFWKELHHGPWEKEYRLHSDFTLLKRCVSAPEAEYTKYFDLIYFDAFSPEVQSEMWTPDFFAKLAANTNKGGVLLTYCTKGDVKRALKAAGFSIEKLPGPIGKREILRASLV